MIKGIDISRYQNYPDWPALDNFGLAFCYIKATQGTNSVSPTLAIDAQNALDSSMLVGFYHFFNPNEDGAAQARFFLNTLKNYWPKYNLLPMMLDIEEPKYDGVTPEQYAQRIQDFVNVVLYAIDQKITIYTGSWYWKTALANTDQFSKAGHKLWVASYTKNPPALFGGWDQFFMWQYAATEKFEGVVTDTDYMYCSYSDLWKNSRPYFLGPNHRYLPLVKALQRRLTSLGFDTQGADGFWGENTTDALFAYQSANNLETTIILDSIFWQKLFNITEQ